MLISSEQIGEITSEKCEYEIVEHLTRSRDGYFSDPLSENFEYWEFNFQPEVEKFQLV